MYETAELAPIMFGQKGLGSLIRRRNGATRILVSVGSSRYDRNRRAERGMDFVAGGVMDSLLIVSGWWANVRR
jgi:hypothetical protein